MTDAETYEGRDSTNAKTQCFHNASTIELFHMFSILLNDIGLVYLDSSHGVPNRVNRPKDAFMIYPDSSLGIWKLTAGSKM
jgi:hypothetical protein